MVHRAAHMGQVWHKCELGTEMLGRLISAAASANAQIAHEQLKKYWAHWMLPKVKVKMGAIAYINKLSSHSRICEIRIRTKV